MGRPLVVGMNGVIGGALFRRLESLQLRPAGTTRRRPAPDNAIYLEMTDREELWPHIADADTAFLCAGIGRLAACNDDPVNSRLINVERTARLAERLHQSGAFIVFPSSNQVFDGTRPLRGARDVPCPVSEYGHQKIATEKAVRQWRGSAVLRTSKVISRPFPLFEQWRRDLLSGTPVQGFEDLHAAPILVEHAVDALLAVAQLRKSGLYQLSGPQDVSYYTLASHFARALGCKPELVIKAQAIDHGIPADFIPRHTTLVSEGLSHISVPDAEELVLSYLRDAA